MLKLLTIDVRTKRKRDRIIKILKKQGRRAFWEEFCDFNGFFYVIFYKPMEG